jgi:hypothetical protein
LDKKEHGISHIHESDNVCKELAKASIEYNKKYHAEIYSKFDFSSLHDDVPTTKTTKTNIPVTPTVSVVPTVDTHKEAKKQGVDNHKESEDFEYTNLTNNMKTIDDKLKKQFTHINNLEKELKMPK